MLSLKNESYKISSYIFLKLLSVIYLIAFISFSVQIKGLIGEHGILPAGEFLTNAKFQYDSQALYMFPTLCWISSSDVFLQMLCYAGAFCSVILFLELYPIPMLFLQWIIYLSLVIVGQVFFGYQWDSLLLEVGFLSIFLAPLSKKIKTPFDSSKVVIFLFWLLLFKLMFMSGIMKLLSGDESWRNLTALLYHYETQPLPTPLAYNFHKLPKYFHVISGLLVLIIEIVFPFFIFASKRFKLIAFFSFFALQILIFISGNYCFFNLLTFILSILLIDDSTWQIFNLKVREAKSKKTEEKYIIWHRAITIPIATLVLLINSIQLLNIQPVNMHEIVYKIYKHVVPFRSINTYGLFTVMTKTRPEIVIYGSNDGETWEMYEFKYKPDKLTKRLSVVAPHQPRLDWQMWFAALSTYKENPWLLKFINELLKGNSDVSKLLKVNPFPNTPPKYIRALLYEYKFSTIGEYRSEGLRWTRKYIGPYAPTFTNGLGARE